MFYKSTKTFKPYSRKHLVKADGGTLHISTTSVAPSEQSVSAVKMKYLDSKFCCSTLLEPVPNTILKPGKFDNTDYSHKQSLKFNQ